MLFWIERNMIWDKIRLDQSVGGLLQEKAKVAMTLMPGEVNFTSDQAIKTLYQLSDHFSVL